MHLTNRAIEAVVRHEQLTSKLMLSVFIFICAVKTIAMNTKIMNLDELTNICGFFYMDNDNWCNNGYNCKNKDCQEQELFDKKGRLVEDIYQAIRKEITPKKGVNKNRVRAKVIKRYKRIINGKEDTFLKSKGYKRIGKCYSFSCPLAYETDEEDLKGTDYEDTNPHEVMIVFDETIIRGT